MMNHNISQLEKLCHTIDSSDEYSLYDHYPPGHFVVIAHVDDWKQLMSGWSVTTLRLFFDRARQAYGNYDIWLTHHPIIIGTTPLVLRGNFVFIRRDELFHAIDPLEYSRGCQDGWPENKQHRKEWLSR